MEEEKNKYSILNILFYSINLSLVFRSDACFYSLAVSCFTNKDRRVHTSIPTCAYMFVKPEIDQGGGVVIIFEII
jgi:hypothetical protein